MIDHRIRGRHTRWKYFGKFTGQREARAGGPMRPPFIHQDVRETEGQFPAGPGPPGIVASAPFGREPETLAGEGPLGRT